MASFVDGPSILRTKQLDEFSLEDADTELVAR